MEKYFHEVLHNPHHTLYLLRVLAPNREEFIRAVIAYKEVVAAAEIILDKDKRPTDYLYDRFDQHLCAVARILNYGEFADTLLKSVEEFKKVGKVE